MEKKAFGSLLRGATNMVSRHADDAGKMLANKQLASTLMPKGQAFDDAIMASLGPQGVRNAQPVAKVRSALDAANMRYPALSSGSTGELLNGALAQYRRGGQLAPYRLSRFSGPYAHPRGGLDRANAAAFQRAQRELARKGPTPSSMEELQKLLQGNSRAAGAQMRSQLPLANDGLNLQMKRDYLARLAPNSPARPRALQAAPDNVPITYSNGAAKPAAPSAAPAVATPPAMPAAAAPTAAAPPPMPVNNPSGMGMAGSVLGGLGAGYLGAEYL
jgi:hypothetical protein